MPVVLSVYVALHFLSFCTGRMIPKIVGGAIANITQFPHVAHLKLKCVYSDGENAYYLCGSSILNQEFVMTAAHCMHDCSEESYIIVSVGHCNKKKGRQYSGYSYVIHEDYDINGIINDIALVRLRTQIQFGDKIKRVALMRKPPYKEKAQIAGWGVICEINNKCINDLKFVDQYVWSTKICQNALHGMPKGTICASSGNSYDYPAVGDSGSALVVRGFIQIGIVSFKKPSLNIETIVYTDTGYFYDWIQETMDFLLCDEDEDE